jgi:hypothetical protein
VRHDNPPEILSRQELRGEKFKEKVDRSEPAFLYQTFTLFSLFCKVDWNNLRTINQDSYILNSIFLLKTENLEQTEAQV